MFRFVLSLKRKTTRRGVGHGDHDTVKHEPLHGVGRIAENDPGTHPGFDDMNVSQRNVGKGHTALRRAVCIDRVVQCTVVIELAARFVLLLRADPDGPPTRLGDVNVLFELKTKCVHPCSAVYSVQCTRSCKTMVSAMPSAINIESRAMVVQNSRRMHHHHA